MNLRSWFYSEAMAVSGREKLLSGLLAVLAMLAIVGVSSALLDPMGAVAVSMSMGAAVVLVCAVPHSPLSQPWPLVGGHLVSAVIGVAMARWVPGAVPAAALAVALAIVAMYWLHCLHPPGGAAALAAVLGGASIHDLGWYYVLAPVGLNALILLIMALIMNNVAPGRRYPLVTTGSGNNGGESLLSGRVPAMEDILAALHEQDIYLDISPADLRALYQATLLQAGKRRLGDVRCADIMSRDPLVLPAQTEPGQARELMAAAAVKSAPVVDERGRIQGIVTLGDFYRHPQRADASLVVLMSTPVTTVYEDDHIIDTLPLFTKGGMHHLPVINRRREVVGMMTRTDLLRALSVILI